MTDHDHDHDHDHDDDEPTNDDQEIETAALRAALAFLCHGHHAQPVMAALSLTLQTVVAATARDIEVVDEFATMFRTALLQRWLYEQQVGNKEH